MKWVSERHATNPHAHIKFTAGPQSERNNTVVWQIPILKWFDELTVGRYASRGAKFAREQLSPHDRCSADRRGIDEQCKIRSLDIAPIGKAVAWREPWFIWPTLIIT